MKQSTFFVGYQNGSEIYKWYQVLLQNLDENVDGNFNKDLDENLAWLTQKTEDLKSNKGNLTFLPHTVNVIELNCKIIKKVAPPPPPFSGLSPPFLEKNLSPPPPPPPPSDSTFGRSYPVLLIRVCVCVCVCGEGGVPTMLRLWKPFFFRFNFSLVFNFILSFYSFLLKISSRSYLYISGSMYIAIIFTVKFFLYHHFYN